MGTVVQFGRHAGAPCVESIGNAANVSNVIWPQPFSPAKRTIAGQRCAGMPRRFQVLTVDGGTPSASETAPVPPKASIAVSTVKGVPVEDMAAIIVRNLRTCQGFATCEMTQTAKKVPIEGMKYPYAREGRDLATMRRALGYAQQQDFADSIGIAKNTWNEIEKGKRNMTLEVARKIRRRHKVSLDFTIENDWMALSDTLLVKMRHLAA